MTAIASPEFISLCRTQLQMLTQRLSESSAALYIADVLSQEGESSNFVPVVSYPEPVESWVANFERATPWSQGRKTRDQAVQLALPGESSAIAAERVIQQSPSNPSNTEALPETDFRWPHILQPEQQLVMPLVYTDVVVGLLVAVRPDRAWQNEERRYLEMVAQSLAGGCVLERRNQWLQSQIAHKRGLQSRQSEVFHNLLHQFRNPLTAVSTFGQLLVKRLDPEDTNQPIATGIVRENKRLRELVTHFDEAVALGDAELIAEAGEKAAARTALLPGQSALSQLSAQSLDQSLGQPLLSAEKGVSAEKGAELGHPLTLSAQFLPDIVGPVLAVSEIVSSEKGVKLYAQVTSDTPLVWGEEAALGEVVSNLVDNAIKYSLAGAQVWVQTGVSRVGSSQQPGMHYQGIVVGDTGPGIPETDLGRLFERNYRGVQAASDIPGTGLGLAIAQSLVHEMQGDIEVISPAVGTPWMPTASMLGQEDVTDLGTGLGTGLSTDLAAGPGSVFIVWLLEVDLGR